MDFKIAAKFFYRKEVILLGCMKNNSISLFPEVIPKDSHAFVLTPFLVLIDELELSSLNQLDAELLLEFQDLRLPPSIESIKRRIGLCDLAYKGDVFTGEM